MRFFYLILIIVFLILSIVFALFNMEQTVSVNFFRWQYPVLPLVGYLYIFFFMGLMIGLAISGIELFKLKNDIVRLNKENKRVKLELDNMRNASIDEEADQSDSEEDESKTAVE